MGVSSGLNLGVRTHKNETDKQQIGWCQGPLDLASGQPRHAESRGASTGFKRYARWSGRTQGQGAHSILSYGPRRSRHPHLRDLLPLLVPVMALLSNPTSALSFDSEDTNIVATPLDDATMGSSNKEEETEAEAEEKSPTPSRPGSSSLRGISQQEESSRDAAKAEEERIQQEKNKEKARKAREACEAAEEEVDDQPRCM